ncbi:MAG: NAD(P)H-hydrate dehydratase [Candidatus Hydrogenedentes bacterium]|nr:NAD(P)H-hydrate dehydratase [Candidatus Hydrogenedentota bacterium]
MTTTLSHDAIRAMLPARPADAHKGTFGHVLVLAGSRGFTGAATLAAVAAGRAGAGLVTVGLPQPIVPFVAPALLECMWIALPATKSDSFAADAAAPALAAAENKQAVVIGPGISTHDETRKFVFEFVRQCKAPMVIDADALNALAVNPGVIAMANAPVTVTPHPGEMARLAGVPTDAVQRDRVTAATQLAARHGCVVVLKGHHTVIAGPGGECAINPTGNAGMATGGTGDVLAGIIGGLAAQGMSAWDAAGAGAYVHGLAGDIAAAERTQRATIARDVLDAIPRAWRTIESL